MNSQVAIRIWLFIGLPLLSLLIFQKTFNLALYGDDWLQLYNLWLEFDVRKALSFFSIKSYLGPYWPQYFFLGLIKNFFGYEATAYFAVSLILRILVNISIYFLAWQFTKNKVIALLATVVFLFSAAGLQTTDWVFNMNTYAGILFLNLALIVYLRMRQIKKIFSWHLITFIALFTLALGTVPVRMHGALPFVTIMDLFLTLFIDRKRLDRFFWLRVTSAAVILLLLIKVGSFGAAHEPGGRFSGGLISAQSALEKGNWDFLFYFFGILGHLTLPDSIKLPNIFSYLKASVFIFTAAGLIISFIIARKNRLSYIIVLVFNFLWALILKTILNFHPLVSPLTIFSIALGGQFIFWGLLTYFNTRKKYPLESATLILGLVWMIVFTIIYWLYTPYLIIDTSARYMIMGSVGFAFVLASFTAILLKATSHWKLLQLATLLVFLMWIVINFQTTTEYFTVLEKNRSKPLTDKTWNSITAHVPTVQKDSPSVFYFTYDNSAAAYMIITFGFWPHAGLIYQIPNWENTPLATESYEELKEFVKTGAPLKNVHARVAKPVALERVFAFDFRNGEITNITDQTRKKLIQDL